MALHRRWPLAVLTFTLAVIAAACDGGGGAPTATPTPYLGRGPALLGTPQATIVEAQAGALVIVNGTLIDGTGAAPVPNAYVVVQGDRVSEVGSGEPALVPDGARVVDARGGTILPGLIDAHVHITRRVVGVGAMGISEDGLRPWLESGITTLRDVGTPPIVFPSVAQFVAGLTKNSKAPRVVWAGPIVTTVGGYPIPVPQYALVAREVATVDEARKAVVTLADGGAGVIKLGLERGYCRDEGWPLMPLDQVRAITDAAHRRGLLVTAHVTSVDEVRLALDGGVDNLAHAPLEPLSDELIQEMVGRGMGIATTASVWGCFAEQAAANAKRYADAGGVIAVATDFGCCDQAPGMEPYLREMEFLLRAGLTPAQLLVAATRGGAVLSNLGDELGTIETGKLADIIIVEGDPLTDIGALRSVRTVVQGGRVVFEAATP